VINWRNIQTWSRGRGWPWPLCKRHSEHDSGRLWYWMRRQCNIQFIIRFDKQFSQFFFEFYPIYSVARHRRKFWTTSVISSPLSVVSQFPAYYCPAAGRLPTKGLTTGFRGLHHAVACFLLDQPAVYCSSHILRSLRQRQQQWFYEDVSEPANGRNSVRASTMSGRRLPYSIPYSNF
jgi:hypothetical protein